MNVLHLVPGASVPRVNLPRFMAWSIKFGSARTAKLIRALTNAAREGRILI